MAGSDCGKLIFLKYKKAYLIFFPYYYYIGLVHNGEMVSECAACQLPVAILENMPFVQAYYM